MENAKEEGKCEAEKMLRSKHKISWGLMFRIKWNIFKSQMEDAVEGGIPRSGNNLLNLFFN